MGVRKQYEFHNSELVLRVKRAPLFFLIILYALAVFSFLAPIIGLALRIADGKGVHFANFVAIGVLGLIGFYLLRIALWNSFGREVIAIQNDTISYFADYKWFRDGLKTYPYNAVLYTIEPIGYEEDNEGHLVIQLDSAQVRCVTRMPADQINEIILLLTNQRPK